MGPVDRATSSRCACWARRRPARRSSCRWRITRRRSWSSRPGRPHVNPPPRSERPTQAIALDGEWEFELKPTMDNRYGDFRLPATDKIIGPEARIFRHAVESGDATAWQEPDFDDSRWERVTYDFGPQFWLLGPLPADATSDALDAELAKLTRVNPQRAGHRGRQAASLAALQLLLAPWDSKAIPATRAGTA